MTPRKEKLISMAYVYCFGSNMLALMALSAAGSNPAGGVVPCVMAQVAWVIADLFDKQARSLK